MAILVQSIDQKQDLDLTLSKQLALVLCSKLISNAASINLLAGHSLIDQGLVILRLSFEHLINIFALLNDEKYLEKFMNNSECNLEKAAIALDKNIRKHNDESMPEELKNEFSNLIDEMNKNPTKSLGDSLYNAAQGTEIKDLYDSEYRHLSIIYSHSTYLSLQNNKPKVEKLDHLLTNNLAYLKLAAAIINSKCN